MEFSRQEYWNGVPCPPPRDLLDPGIEPMSFMSPALTGRFFTSSSTWGAPSCLCARLENHHALGKKMLPVPGLTGSAMGPSVDLTLAIGSHVVSLHQLLWILTLWPKVLWFWESSFCPLLSESLLCKIWTLTRDSKKPGKEWGRHTDYSSPFMWDTGGLEMLGLRPLIGRDISLRSISLLHLLKDQWRHWTKDGKD